MAGLWSNLNLSTNRLTGASVVDTDGDDRRTVVTGLVEVGTSISYDGGGVCARRSTCINTCYWYNLIIIYYETAACVCDVHKIRLVASGKIRVGRQLRRVLEVLFLVASRFVCNI